MKIILASGEALDLFTQAVWASIDGTFDVCELKLMLTAIVISVNGIAVPVAFMLGNSKKEESYRAFFELIKNRCHHNLNLRAVLTDFEEGLRHAASGAFSCASFGDRFHFVKCNVTRVRGYGLSEEEMNRFKEDLRQVWEQPDESHFNERKKIFLAAWRERLPDFGRYFNETWLKKYPPRMWAMYGREHDYEIPTGSAISEGWNSKLQKKIKPGAQVSAAAGVDEACLSARLYPRKFIFF